MQFAGEGWSRARPALSEGGGGPASGATKRVSLLVDVEVVTGQRIPAARYSEKTYISNRPVTNISSYVTTLCHYVQHFLLSIADVHKVIMLLKEAWRGNIRYNPNRIDLTISERFIFYISGLKPF